MKADEPADWQLPHGVTRGIWDYTRSDHIASEYDTFVSDHPLTQLDLELVRHYFQGEGLVADLGCGTGRALLPLVQQGLRGLGIDLSQAMLTQLQAKARRQKLPIACMRANLVDLDGIADNTIDYAMCLFSTLGMIHGRANRAQVVRHTHRILKPGGWFILHVHNRWFNLRDPGGPWWLLKNLVQAAISASVEPGDRYFPYRGIPNFFLHAFSGRELRTLLRDAGFRIHRWTAVSPQGRPVRRWASVRATGWIVVCRAAP